MEKCNLCANPGVIELFGLWLCAECAAIFFGEEVESETNPV